MTPPALAEIDHYVPQAEQELSDVAAETDDADLLADLVLIDGGRDSHRRHGRAYRPRRRGADDRYRQGPDRDAGAKPFCRAATHSNCRRAIRSCISLSGCAMKRIDCGRLHRAAACVPA
jgi:hypothetical protein